MRGTCRITSAATTVTTDAAGDTSITPTTIYEGPVYMRYPGVPHEQTPEVAGATVALSRILVRIPFPHSGVGQWFVTPPTVRPGQVVEVLSDPDNPQLVGTRVRVASIDDQSQATAQRLLCEDFQAGVAML